MTISLLSPAEVERARRALAPHLRPTPLRRSFALRRQRAHIKLECWQPTGSFKVRGALNFMAALEPRDRARGVITASAGNHGLGVAFAAQALGAEMPVTVFVPETTPLAKVDKLRTFPVDVRQTGRTYDDAFAEATAHADRTGACFVHAFEHHLTAAGQGTVGLEILEDCPDVGTIVVPVGGGGLVSGIATVVKAKAPAVKIVAVQPEASPALRESLKRGAPLLDYPFEPTLADGLAGGIGEIVFAHRGLIDEVVTVAEAEIEEAIVRLLAEDQVVAEGAGAVGVAAVLAGGPAAGSDAPVVAVVTGGNIDARVLARLLSSRV